MALRVKSLRTAARIFWGYIFPLHCPWISLHVAFMRLLPLMMTAVWVCICAQLAASSIYADFELAHGDTPLGTVTVLLKHEQAPRPVANFIGLATGAFPFVDPATERPMEGVRFYDNTVFHRLIHDFMIQGGDRAGTGGGGPGFVFQDQFHPDLRHDEPYKLSMAHSGPHTNGSQFFITLIETPWLDNNHSIFGEVVEGREIIDGFRDRDLFPTGQGDRPATPIRLVTVTIRGLEQSGFDIHAPELGLPRFRPVNLGMQVSAILEPQEDEQDFEVLGFWDRRRLVDYQLFASPDLSEWYRLGFALSMDDEDNYGIGISGVLGNLQSTRREFYRMVAVDYSHVPVVPQNPLFEGVEMTFEVAGGRLTLSFEDNAPGGWMFSKEGAEPKTGWLDWTLLKDTDIIGSTGLFINQRSLVSLLTTTALEIDFDQLVDDSLSQFVDITLSYHSQTGGWAEIALLNNFLQVYDRLRVPFTVTWP